MENFAVSLVFIAVIGFFAFRMWLRHNKRVLIHRERLAAIEKGIEPPPQMEEETRRGNINIQRILLLAGLVWISLGIGTYLVLSAVYASGFRSSDFLTACSTSALHWCASACRTWWCIWSE